MDLILMRVMVRGARFIVASLSARQVSCCQPCSATWNPGMDCAPGSGSVARSNLFGGEKSPKRPSTNSKIWRKFLLFFPIKELSTLAHFFFLTSVSKQSRQLSGSLSGDARYCGSLAGASAARFLLLVNLGQNKILTYTNNF